MRPSCSRDLVGVFPPAGARRPGIGRRSMGFALLRHDVRREPAGLRPAGLALAVGLPLLLLAGATTTASAETAIKPPCSAEKMQELRSPATDSRWRVTIDCSVTLEPGDVIEKEVLLVGEAASGVRFDCNGATLGSPDKAGRMRNSHRLVIQTRQADDGSWHPPRDVTVSGCNIAGTMRIAGMAGEQARLSSLTAGHTERAQSAAPTAIRIEETNFVGTAELFKLLVGVGVTDLAVTGSRFEGTQVGTTVYLSDEAARIRISDSRFDAVAQRREQIAIDGTADVTIERNVFSDVQMGGVFIYRNCGEQGRIRVQEPSGNVIRDNIFVGAGVPPRRPTVWIGSRNEKRAERPEQCVLDDGLATGSSLSPGAQPQTERDEAHSNRVEGNRFVGLDPAEAILDNDVGNVVTGNVRAAAESP